MKAEHFTNIHCKNTAALIERVIMRSWSYEQSLKVASAATPNCDLIMGKGIIL